MTRILIIIGVFISINIQAQFTGQSGVFYLGTAGVPISTVNYSNPNISGVVVRFKWTDLETTPGNFNWTFIDGEIAKAKLYNKKVTLQPLSTPSWLGSIGVQQYYYIDTNSAHSTYNQIVSGVIPWDTIYIKRYKILLQNLASKYANDTTVSYINTIGGAFSRNLPQTVLMDTTLKTSESFYKVFNYNADILGNIMNQMTDLYMSLFPNTPLWCSVDYVTFQTAATGQPFNYLASLVCNYGIKNYPDRFGLWREDIAGCNPPASFKSGSQWYIMQQNPSRTGAQMLWNVQDGPLRMNKCGILPNTKTAVMDSSVNRGLYFGMRYLEIYGVDISDVSLVTSIQQANIKLIAKGNQWNSMTGINEQTFKANFSISPNPAIESLKISFPDNPEKQFVQIFNTIGVLVKEVELSKSDQINISNFKSGFYFICLKDNHFQTLRFIKL